MKDLARKVAAVEAAGIEAPAMPPIPEDRVWCDVRNERVGVSECATSCASPEHRPVCWLGRIYRDEPLEGGNG